MTGFAMIAEKKRRRSMKKAVELLKVIVDGIYAADITSESKAESVLENIHLSILKVLELLESPPRWETPEQWEKRTEEKYPDYAPVYFRGRYGFAKTWNRWKLGSFEEAIWVSDYWKDEFQIICATEAGPPPDGWRPE
jgi:hypothetical protein